MAISSDVRPQTHLSCDLVVVGGGAAGVAAAVTAARRGLKVVLVERYGFCGGGAVAGMSGTICGLYTAVPEGTREPEQVVFGFADEFTSRLSAEGGLTDVQKYGRTATRVHDPLKWRELADALLVEAGVQIIYHAVATGVLLEGGEAIEGITAWTKQGPLRIDARVTVDASGDADLVAMAGFPSTIGQDGHVQNPTMIFRLGGVDLERFHAAYGHDTIMPPVVSEAIREANKNGKYDLPRAKIWLFPTTRPSELLCNCTRVIGRDGRELNAILFRDFTEAELVGRLQVREYSRFFREHLTGCEASYVVDTGTQVGVRQTRQAQGLSTLTNDDVLAGRKFGDGIARSPWPIELHAGAVPKVEWLYDDFYEIPFGCLVPHRGLNLLIAGRCLSAQHEAVASARVTAQCFGYGQAVGIAAEMAISDHILTANLSGAEVRERLNRDGARLD